jgi:hypothetical protein
MEKIATNDKNTKQKIKDIKRKITRENETEDLLSLLDNFGASLVQPTPLTSYY